LIVLWVGGNALDLNSNGYLLGLTPQKSKVIVPLSYREAALEVRLLKGAAKLYKNDRRQCKHIPTFQPGLQELSRRSIGTDKSSSKDIGIKNRPSHTLLDACKRSVRS